MRKIRLPVAPLNVFTVLMFVLVLLPQSKAWAVDWGKSVIVMFEPAVVTLPEGYLQCSLDSVSVALSPIEIILQADSASVVALFDPNFALGDTLATSRLGDVYLRTDWTRVFVIEASSETAADSLVAHLTGVAGVVYAERPSMTPVALTDPLPYAYPSPCKSDPKFAIGDQWPLQNLGSNIGGQLGAGTNDADIDAVEAWEITPGAEVQVAVFDEGVNENHVDLSGKVSGEHGYVGLHGTTVAGVIAAKANDKAVVGVNPSARIYNRIVVADGWLSRLDHAVKGVLQEGIPIVNMSYGSTETQTERLLMRDAYNAGVFLVAAIGYDYDPPGQEFPSGYYGVTAVGFTDNHDHVGSDQKTTTEIQLVAPGYLIMGIDPESTDDARVYSGTSFAAPLAAGVGSLLLSYNQSLDSDDLRQIIVRSLDDIGGTGGWTSQFGYGRLNAEKALEMIAFPNELHHAATQSNNVVSETLNVGYMRFLLPGSLFSFYHSTKRYEVRTDVTFPVEYETVPEVWGRGHLTTGFNTDTPTNYGYGYCQVVSGSETTTGCTLKTYVYEYLDVSDPQYRWVPCAPADVRFAYTVVGRASHHYALASYVQQDGHLLTMPEHWAVGCPGGDADTIVVEAKFDATEFEYPPARADLILSQPANAKASLFPQCSPIIPDGDPVYTEDNEFSNGCYKATFTIPAFSGFCGIDSSRVRYEGGLLGYVPLNIRSPDMISVPPRATVSLSDLVWFWNYYPSPPHPYDERADLFAPAGMGLPDFGFFVAHYATSHHYTPPSMIAGETESPVQGDAIVDIANGSLDNGDRMLNVSMRLEGVPAYQVGLVALRCNNPRLEFVSWSENPLYGGATICSPVEVGQDHLLAVAVLGNKSMNFAARIGMAVFRVLGEDSLILDQSDLEPVIADLLLSTGTEGPLNTSRRLGAEPRLVDHLTQNFPNPFNPQTTLAFSLKHASDVSLTIYDVGGRRVRELVNEHRTPGAYKVVWDGRDGKGTQVSSGVYFYKLVAGSFVDTKKMMLLK